MATIDELIQKLKSGDDAERALAAQQLGTQRTLRATEPLIEALQNDPSPMVRKTAAQALGENGDRRALQPLLDALDESNLSLRESAIRALGLLGDTRAIQPLIHELQKFQSLTGRLKTCACRPLSGGPSTVSIPHREAKNQPAHPAGGGFLNSKSSCKGALPLCPYYTPSMTVKSRGVVDRRAI